ncbi:bacteriohemerythrin [Magnetospirillum sulfuroxidans]|uniref:Hemerythrin family protein n=1 Tax=Magnetospirillum sulfuroxidans TaxID=611300 RepID=A0ABS5I7W3_9PROT|nr:bacteriohemerythrin [Magnetospirillum sulfuroxidans]MBR9970507.1 hemerythrin family protein [Magnetospirillum sulfuroxidans]
MAILLEWNSDYELGVPAMDADHRDLMDMCNLFLEKVQAQTPPTQLADSLDRLILRTRAHFLAEERMLDRHGYPALVVHKAEHERLIREAEALSNGLRTDQGEKDLDSIIAETSDFLRSWLLEHIRNNDRPYKPFLRSLN